MKKSIVLIFLSLLLTSCLNEVELNVTFKKIVSSAIKKSGAIVQGFGDKGSIPLSYSDFKEDVLANFKPVTYYCLQDSSCIYHVRAKITGASDDHDFLIKVNSQFQIDTSFGVNGYLHLASINMTVGNALFGWYYFLGVNSTDSKMYIGFGNGVARLLPNGKIDTSFGTNGIFVMDRNVYNYFPTKIVQSNADELLILTAIAGGGSSVSSGNFGAALISVSKNGAFKSIQDFNNTSFVNYRAYNNSFAFPEDIGQMLIVDNAGVSENYYAYMSSQFLMIKKTDLAGNAIAGFAFPGGGYNTTSSYYRVTKLFDIGNEIYVFMAAPYSEASAAKLIVFDKSTGAINASKSKSYTSGAMPLVIDDVLKSSNGFILSLKQCLIVNTNNDCGRAHRFVSQIDLNGDTQNIVQVATSTGSETDLIGRAKSFLQKRNSDYYVLNFSPQFVGPLGESYTKLSVKKFDETVSLDNSFGTAGDLVRTLAYTIKLSFVNLADKILLDDDINSYYLVSYDIGLNKVRKIIKLDQNINAVSSFGTAGVINLSSFLEVNTIELDEVNKHLYVVYTKLNGVNKEVYIRRYNMVTGVLDTGFGSAGELFVQSGTGNSNGYSSYYSRQVIKNTSVLNPRSFILKNGFVLTLQDNANRGVLNIFKFDFSSEVLSSKVLTGADYPASSAYAIQDITNLYVTSKNNSLFITARSNDSGMIHNEILKLSASDLSVDTSFGTNGLMFFNGGTISVNGSTTEIHAREVFSVTDDYIYLMGMHQIAEVDGGGNYVRFHATPNYQRYSYSGVADTAFENITKQEIAAYETQFSGGHTVIKIAQSTSISKGNRYVSFLLFGLYASSIQDYTAMASDQDALYASLILKTFKLDFGENESVSTPVSKTIPFLDFMAGSLTDESFLLQEMYSFDKGDYVYKVAVSGISEDGQAMFKLFKLYK